MDKNRKKHANNIILCNLYIPPNGDLNKAIDYLNRSLPSINVAECDLFIIGDWNVNYKNTLSPNYKKLIFFENCNNLKQIIKDTTRNTDKSKTLIDFILTNVTDIADSGTIDTFINDHQPIFVIKKKQRTKSNQVSFEGRSYKSLDLDLLLSNLDTQNWEEFYTLNDPEKAWLTLHDEINEELDKQCPVRSSTVKDYVPDWINPGLRELIKDRDYFYRKAKKTNSEDDWNIAKHLRNTASSGIRKAKSDFIRQKLSDYAKDGSKFWRKLKQIYPSTKNKSSRGKIKLIHEETKEIVPEAETADYINDYFVNVGNLPATTRSRSSYKPNSIVKRKKRKNRKSGRCSGNDTADRMQPNTQPPPWSLTVFTEDKVLDVIRAIEIS